MTTSSNTHHQSCTVSNLQSWGAHKTAHLVCKGRGPETTVAHLFQEIGADRAVAHIIATENRLAAYYALQLPVDLSRDSARILRRLAWGFRAEDAIPWYVRWVL